MKITQRFLTARAKAGAILLDLLQPGWAERINVQRLRLEDCQACVLGQLYGGYSAGLEKVFAMRVRPREQAPDLSFNAWCNERDAAGADGGFCIPVGSGREQYDRLYGNLTKAWVREIEKRRKPVTPAQRRAS